MFYFLGTCLALRSYVPNYLETHFLASEGNNCWHLASALRGEHLGLCADREGDPSEAAEVQALMASGTSSSSGIPLDEYRKDVPPGWEPGNPRYPLKQFLERVKMWYRLYDGPDEAVGPLLAGRLRGRAQQIAMTLRLPDPTGHVDVGDAALVRLSVDEVLDPVTGALLQAAIPSGVQALLHALKSAFGEAEQLQATRALELFFEFKRGKLPIPEWSVQWELNYEEAALHAGLEVNPVAKTYLYLKSSQLPQKSIDDLLLQAHADMRRFEEIRTLLLRMAHRHADQPGVLYEEAGQQAYYGDDVDSTSWSTVTDPRYEEWQDDDLYAWYEGWYEGDNDYYDDYYGDHEGWPGSWYESGFDDEGPAEQADGDPVEPPANDESFYKGKGKSRASTMGLGCSTCGSKWHNTHSCPLNSQPKGKGKGFSKPKGYNKGYGKPFRKGFGRGKGFGKKGKSYSKKGFGKRGFWSEELPHGFQDYYGGSYLMNFKDAPKNDFSDAQSSTARPSVIKLDSPQKEELLIGKKVRFEDKSQVETDEKVNKTLNFPEMASENHDLYHVVRGKRICGLLVDPGAASGLVGTETLRELMDAIPQDDHHKIAWGPSTTSVTGISGQSDSTLARISLPIDINNEAPASYTADLIGGQGSLCPALLPNTSLRQMRSAVFTEWYQNGDGVLVCSPNGQRLDHPDANLVIMRILLTESGHYIIPINQQSDNIISDEDKVNIKKMLQGNSQPSQTTTLEQTGNNNHGTNDLLNSDKNQISSDNKDKLQFKSEETSAGNQIHDGLRMDPVSNGLSDGLRGDSKQVASDEQPIQVLLGKDYNIDYDESSTEYAGDIFPGHLEDGKLRYLQKMYRAIPEEFYTKTKKVPVTPYNARSWARKHKGKTFHLWEWCSGSGRLSLLALLSGLCVLFPIDYRYGWDLGLPEHQRILHEVEMDIGEPDVLFYSPTCRPWSISSTKRDLDQTQRERAAEMPTVEIHQEEVQEAGKGEERKHP